MAFAKLIAFDRPLTVASVTGRPGRTFTESEVAALTQDSYRRGADAARAMSDQQMVDLRADIGRLSDGLLQKLTSIEPLLVAQLREALPGLASDLARRLLAGYEPPAEVVSRLCVEALTELLPERDNLELAVSARDAALLETIKPGWMQRYPGLRIRVEPALGPGDCQVRSRFGLTDARLQTKLVALAQSISPT